MHRLDLICFGAPFRFSLRTMRHLAAQANALTLVAECEHTLVGFVIVEVNAAEGSAYVATLDVVLAHRRTGVAAKLLLEIERQAVSAGASRIWLHVHTGNKAALGFYERQGYAAQSLIRRFYGPGLDAWMYTKKL